MRLLLVWPNSRNEVLGWGDLGAIAEPLALEYLGAALGADGHEVRILDLRLNPGSLDDVLHSYQPAIVGVTAFSMHVLTALRICARVKELLPNALTIAGGHHATLLPEDFFAPQVDYVVCGEGTAPLRAIVARLEGGQMVEQVPGVWSKHGEKFVFGGAQAPFEIDAIPHPDRTLTAADRERYFIDWMRPVALLRTSVGCPFRCVFCSLWKIMDGKYHIRDEQAVVAELRNIKEDFVFLVDDEAFINGRRMIKLAEAIKAAGIRKRFFCYARIDSVRREQDALRAWREVGLERLFIGIDGISQAELNDMNKSCTVATIEEGLDVAERLGLEVFAQFVVSPEYDRRDFQTLVRFIEHRKIRYPSFTVLTPIPGTALLNSFDHVTEKQGNGRPNWDLFDCQNAVTATRLPKKEFRRRYRDLYHVFKGAYTQYREQSHIIDEAARSRASEQAVATA